MRYGLLSPVLLLLAGCTQHDHARAAEPGDRPHDRRRDARGRDAAILRRPARRPPRLPLPAPVARADGRAGLPLHGLRHAERPPAQPRRLGRGRRRPAAPGLRAARGAGLSAQPATFPSTASQNSAAMSGAAEALHLADARRRGDVDLGQIIADHVDADEDEAAALQLRADRLADLALALRQLVGSGRPPTCMLERASPSAGTRLMAPASSPSIRMMRLSPLRTSGR